MRLRRGRYDPSCQLGAAGFWRATRTPDGPATLAVVGRDGRSRTALLAATLGDIARARNMAQLARDTGMTREGLYKALSGQGNPSLATIMKVMKALVLRLSVAPAAHA